jgi:large subunit ribosomal protein L10
LRKNLREKGVEFHVAKKTLIRLAAKENGFEELSSEVLEGPVGVAFCMEDALSGAKLLHAFSKQHEKLKLRGALFEGRVLSVAETKQLALIPGKEELIAKFIYLIKYPITGFHGVFKNTLGGFVRVLNAIREKNEKVTN